MLEFWNLEFSLKERKVQTEDGRKDPVVLHSTGLLIWSHDMENFPNTIHCLELETMTSQQFI